MGARGARGGETCPPAARRTVSKLITALLGAPSVPLRRLPLPVLLRPRLWVAPTLPLSTLDAESDMVSLCSLPYTLPLLC